MLQELNLHQKCQQTEINSLRKWYKSYSNSEKFPPEPRNLPDKLLYKRIGRVTKTKMVYDQSKNKAEIILPPNLKNDITVGRNF